MVKYSGLERDVTRARASLSNLGDDILVKVKLK